MHTLCFMWYYTLHYLSYVLVSISASKPAVVKKSRIGAKSSKTAAKVALMKMKMHAKGDSGCPETERVYLRVYPPSQCNKEPQPMFFSQVMLTFSVFSIVIVNLFVSKKKLL